MVNSCYKIMECAVWRLVTLIVCICSMTGYRNGALILEATMPLCIVFFLGIRTPQWRHLIVNKLVGNGADIWQRSPSLSFYNSWRSAAALSPLKYAVLWNKTIHSNQTRSRFPSLLEDVVSVTYHEVKLPRFLIQVPRHKGIRRSGVIAPLILKVGTEVRRVVSFTLLPSFSPSNATESQ